jgi:hypothetical protein
MIVADKFAIYASVTDDNRAVRYYTGASVSPRSEYPPRAWTPSAASPATRTGLAEAQAGGTIALRDRPARAKCPRTHGLPVTYLPIGMSSGDDLRLFAGRRMAKADAPGANAAARIVCRSSSRHHRWRAGRNDYLLIISDVPLIPPPFNRCAPFS